jgi:hypothetical protein
MSGKENDKKVDWTQEAKARIMAANVSCPQQNPMSPK